MKVLLADDDSFLRALMTSRLKKFGFEVDTAADGIEALAKMKSSNPDVVLLDLIMPNKDGFAVLQEAKLDGAISHIPIIVTSSLDTAEDIKKTEDLGAKDHFDKTSSDYEPLKQKILNATKTQSSI